MIGTLIFNVIAVYFAWQESSGKNKYGLKLAIFTIFVFLALRYDFGNDYYPYINFFNTVKLYGFNLFEFDKGYDVIKGAEYGWLFINKVFAPIGFFALVGTLALFSCYILFRFIKLYVPNQYYWFAVFFYVFQPDLMLIQLSAMRQAVSISFFLLAIDFIIKEGFRNILIYLVLIYIATLFHSSAYILFPFIILRFFKLNFNYIYIAVVFILFISIFVFAKNILQHIDTYINLYFREYNVYTTTLRFLSPSEVGLGLVLTSIIYLFVMYYAKYEFAKKNNVLYTIAIISFLFFPLSLVIMIITRINLYLLPILMAVYPLIFTKFKSQESRLVFIAFIASFVLYQFFMFFLNPTWIKAYSSYQTIFSAPNF